MLKYCRSKSSVYLLAVVDFDSLRYITRNFTQSVDNLLIEKTKINNDIDNVFNLIK